MRPLTIASTSRAPAAAHAPAPQSFLPKHSHPSCRTRAISRRHACTHHAATPALGFHPHHAARPRPWQSDKGAGLHGAAAGDSAVCQRRAARHRGAGRHFVEPRRLQPESAARRQPLRRRRQRVRCHDAASCAPSPPPLRWACPSPHPLSPILQLQLHVLRAVFSCGTWPEHDAGGVLPRMQHLHQGHEVA